MPMDNDARTQWNAKQYKQVKVYVSMDVAADFKAACAARGESMAAVISRAMLDYCGGKPEKQSKARVPAPDYSTRGKRRTALRYHAEQIESIRDAEENYKDNIPETLQGGSVMTMPIKQWRRWMKLLTHYPGRSCDIGYTTQCTYNSARRFTLFYSLHYYTAFRLYG